MTDQRVQLAPEIRATLAALRRRIRRYVWLEGLSGAIVWLGAASWASLAIDWFFEPSTGPRLLAVVGILAGLAAVVATLILRRLVVPLRDSSMALLLERRYPEFRDSLLTAVELAEPQRAADPYDPTLLARTFHQARAPLAHVRLDSIFNPRPLRRRALTALVLTLSLLAFALAQPGLVAVWARRTFALSNELWPRFARLEIEGFEDGTTKVAKGTDLDIVARADLAMPLVPDVVEIQYHEGGRKPMNRDGTADPERDRFQQFSYTFRGLLAPVTFDVVGGDDAVRNLSIEVVDNPAIVELLLDCEYPSYIGRPQRSFPYSGLMQLPAGSRVTLRARTNKDLVRVLADTSTAEASTPAPLRTLKPTDPANPRSFQYVLDKLDKDATLQFTLFDTDGIKSREPVRVTISALEDRRPELAILLRGIGAAITPQAQLPASGRVTDDYGLARVWFEYAVDQRAPATAPIAAPKGNATELPLEQRVLDVRPLDLKPGQKLAVSVKAEDRHDLPPGPNVGTSDRWLLDVVTPEQLRTMLQARELVLRQRFEAVIEDMAGTREALARLGSPGDSAKPSGAEPGDKPASEPPLSPQRQVAQRRTQVQWAAQNSVKDTHETLGVADAIADIREELINNRIDTEELKARLEQGIANPLRRIAEELFPEFDRRLDRLDAAMADPAAAPEALARVVQQSDAILLAMRQVLARMIELEDFNEVVELLRSIIQAQDRVDAETKNRRKERLRSLLE